MKAHPSINQAWKTPLSQKLDAQGKFRTVYNVANKSNEILLSHEPQASATNYGCIWMSKEYRGPKHLKPQVQHKVLYKVIHTRGAWLESTKVGPRAPTGHPKWAPQTSHKATSIYQPQLPSAYGRKGKYKGLNLSPLLAQKASVC